MRVVKHFSIWIAWIVAFIMIASFPTLFLVVGLIIFLATPFYRKVMPSCETYVLPLATINKFSALSNMTTLGLTKAAIYGHKIPKMYSTKILNKTKGN